MKFFMLSLLTAICLAAVDILPCEKDEMDLSGEDAPPPRPQLVRQNAFYDYSSSTEYIVVKALLEYWGITNFSQQNVSEWAGHLRNLAPGALHTIFNGLIEINRGNELEKMILSWIRECEWFNAD
ncbi:hypothetical protein ACFLY6_00950 [Candidatus Dependentiae bacterium]